jgi:hypothetical protein
VQCEHVYLRRHARHPPGPAGHLYCLRLLSPSLLRCLGLSHCSCGRDQILPCHAGHRSHTCNTPQCPAACIAHKPRDPAHRSCGQGALGHVLCGMGRCRARCCEDALRLPHIPMPHLHTHPHGHGTTTAVSSQDSLLLAHSPYLLFCKVLQSLSSHIHQSPTMNGLELAVDDSRALHMLRCGFKNHCKDPRLLSVSNARSG